jgi:hypothetical protein
MQRFHDRIWWLISLTGVLTGGLAGLLPTGVARANDSSAGLDGGQLVLKQADNIRMESEDLFLSMKEVRIRYEFRNTGPKDVETIVAFPLPPMPAKADVDEGIMDNVSYDPSSDNPLGFVCRVDGQVVKTRTDRKETKGKELKDNGTTLTYYWTQKFPAGRTVVVEHSYKPALWQSFAPKPTPEDTARYCIDAGTGKTIDAIASPTGSTTSSRPRATGADLSATSTSPSTRATRRTPSRSASTASRRPVPPASSSARRTSCPSATSPC